MALRIFLALRKTSNINESVLRRWKSPASSAQRLHTAGETQSSHAGGNVLLYSDPWRGEDAVAPQEQSVLCVHATYICMDASEGLS